MIFLKRLVNFSQGYPYCHDVPHEGILPHVYTYPLNLEMAQKKMIRKSGFHGINYSFVLRDIGKFFQKVCSVPPLVFS